MANQVGSENAHNPVVCDLRLHSRFQQTGDHRDNSDSSSSACQTGTKLLKELEIPVCDPQQIYPLPPEFR